MPDQPDNRPDTIPEPEFFRPRFGYTEDRGDPLYSITVAIAWSVIAIALLVIFSR